MTDKPERPPLTAEAVDAMFDRIMTLHCKDLPPLGVGVFKDQDGRPLLTLDGEPIAIIPYAFEAIKQQMNLYLQTAHAAAHQEDRQGK